jgi:hypothetical protein
MEWFWGFLVVIIAIAVPGGIIASCLESFGIVSPRNNDQAMFFSGILFWVVAGSIYAILSRSAKNKKAYLEHVELEKQRGEIIRRQADQTKYEKERNDAIAEAKKVL